MPLRRELLSAVAAAGTVRDISCCLYCFYCVFVCLFVCLVSGIALVLVLVQGPVFVLRILRCSHDLPRGRILCRRAHVTTDGENVLGPMA